MSNGVTTTQVVNIGTTRAAMPGDGGLIYFGGNSLTTYDFQDLRSGSVIDNADISYMTRIEQQGGGPIYLSDLNGDMTFSAQYDSPFNQKVGVIANGVNANDTDQTNSPKKLTISNSNSVGLQRRRRCRAPGVHLAGLCGGLPEHPPVLPVADPG